MTGVALCFPPANVRHPDGRPWQTAPSYYRGSYSVTYPSTGGAPSYCSGSYSGEREIRAGEIRAYRAWLRYLEDGPLESVISCDTWPLDEPMRAAEGSLGIHAWKTLQQAIDYAQLCKGVAQFPAQWGSGYVVGPVLLWGEIGEFEHGYLAEFALPVYEEIMQI